MDVEDGSKPRIYASTSKSRKPTVVWEMDVDVADDIFVRLASARAGGATGKAVEHVDELYRAVAQADRMTGSPVPGWFEGCPKMFDLAGPVTLAGPRLVGTFHDPVVIFPAGENHMAVAAEAIRIVKDAYPDLNINSRTLQMKTHIRVVLRGCEHPDHELHPIFDEGSTVDMDPEFVTAVSFLE